VRPLKRPRRQPQVDRRLVGISFVDVLFALVVAEALEPIKHWRTIPAVGWSHLALVIVLVITSWVGYHNSFNRPTYFIRFPNLPLWQFLIDICLVIVYWVAAVSAEGSGNPIVKKPAAWPEAAAVAASFGLYVIWDRIGKAVRDDDRYAARRKDRDVPERRRVTKRCLVAAAVILVAVLAVRPDSRLCIIAVDVVLIALLIIFRVTKERAGTPKVDYVFHRVTSEGLWRAQCDDGSHLAAHGRTKQEAVDRLVAVLKEHYGRECDTELKQPPAVWPLADTTDS
jgi:hypothetical protein